MVTDLLSTFIRLSYRQLGYLFFPWEQYWIRCFLLFFFFFAVCSRKQFLRKSHSGLISRLSVCLFVFSLG